ncbi:hypothetical protein COCC4DRAFT_155369 [Bipolaris maydis ATCC 48331]|uniref:Uncharacterized protein n=2 Tax=Cochliobolus heterostrophus TaxID=5016 RepID=M2TPL1_COCH5|nr:uncharacterized protein COCC4DRAFT_155369 [Bipolaris maydis ATCC 48331]EMD88499.1 hypothetical protein COCHEDRAFT_1216407 [Bipolaris maydis C5]KAJ5026332.1 hypothetical protein J3E73DRAFT_48044 [Bipolaris maydis]ENH98594.1 hypothetical protein COCC4DRAFT_155369 [Bipolaris maydis ATCC 48331]KAJ5051409.1 putative short chain dehydrogenase/oxidoreductase [Bipolaris maydis]KAJ6196454.1 putative short chain dehydrogenase/oxidoreductase [Bipolaris maydis]
MTPLDFTGKVAIVSGCASGIGLATTRLLLSFGAKVFGVDVNNADLIHSAFTFHRCDITSSVGVLEAIQHCLELYGARIDILANVAEVMDAFSSADTVTESEWHRVLSINLTACMYLTKAVLPHMLPYTSGAIVNVGSRASLGGGAAGIAYTASKHGLIGLTKNIAWRFHKQGIRCNAVCPGNTQSNIAQSMHMNELDQAAYKVAIPVLDLHAPSSSFQAVIKAEEVANVVVFLASDMSVMVNGAVIPVDNAWSAL